MHLKYLQTNKLTTKIEHKSDMFFWPNLKRRYLKNDNQLHTRLVTRIF